MILGIDTSAGQCAIAILGATTITRATSMSRGHGEALFPMIEDGLAEAGIGYGGLSRIGVCTGPGSFTGLRVGISAARGLALGLGVPVIGVTRFEAVVTEGFSGTLQIAGRRDFCWSQDYDRGLPVGDPRQEAGAGEELLADALAVATIAATTAPGVLPAPLYLRSPDAALPSIPPPVILD